MATCLPISALDAFKRLPSKLMGQQLDDADDVIGAVVKGLDARLNYRGLGR